MVIRFGKTVAATLGVTVLLLPAVAAAQTPLHLSATVTNADYYDAGNNVAWLGGPYSNSTILQGKTWTFTNNSSRAYKMRIRVAAFEENECASGTPMFGMSEYLQVKVKPGATKTKAKTKKIGGYTDLLDWDGDGEWTDPVEYYCIMAMTWPSKELPDGESIQVEADLLQL